jgi:threonine/homoserine/homoserine lactone efflux protein
MFWSGLILGMAIAAPVGPIAILCIRRTLAHGRRWGLVTGLGAATADALYATLASLGVGLVTSILLEQGRWLNLAGGLLLCGLGAMTMLARPAQEREVASAGTLGGTFASAFLLTLSNPMTILSFATLFAGARGGGEGAELAGAGLFVAGIFSGSAIWWLVLSTSVSLVRHRLSPRILLWVGRVAGLVLVVFGLRTVLQVVGVF